MEASTNKITYLFTHSLRIGLAFFLLQLVWKSYTKIGCGQAVANKEDGTVSTYIVALYEPPADRSTRKDLLSNVFAPKPKQ